MIDDESLVKTRTNICLSYASAVPSYSVPWARKLSSTNVKTHKLLQVCKQVVTNLFTSCREVVFALLVPICCNNL